jgi:hypothetical protein
MSSVKNIEDKNQVKSGFEVLTLKFLPRIKQVAFIRDEMAFVLDDGRIIYIPISWSEKLSKATEKQKLQYINTGVHIFWDEIDEIIGIKNILFGQKLHL